MPNPNGHTSNLKHYQPKWNSGKTRTIRVPIVLAEQVLEYAHTIDKGDSPDTSDSTKPLSFANSTDSPDTSDLNLEQIAQAVLSDPAVTRGGKDRGAAKRAINAFIASLKS